MKSIQATKLILIYVLAGAAIGLAISVPRSSPPNHVESGPPSASAPSLLGRGQWIWQGADQDQWLARYDALKARGWPVSRIFEELEGAYFDQALLKSFLMETRDVPLEEQEYFLASFSQGPALTAPLTCEESLSYVSEQQDVSLSIKKALLVILIEEMSHTKPEDAIEFVQLYGPSELKNILLRSIYKTWSLRSPEAAAKDSLARDLTSVFGTKVILYTALKSWTQQQPLEAIQHLTNLDLPIPLKNRLLSRAIFNLPSTLESSDYHMIFDRFLADDASERILRGINRGAFKAFFETVGNVDLELGYEFAAQLSDITTREKAEAILEDPR